MMIEDHTNHWTRTIMTTGPNQDRQKHSHRERHSDFMINHEGPRVKQVSILRNTYRVYIVPHSLVQRVIKIFHDNRGHQGISRTINMMKRCFWLRKM